MSCESIGKYIHATVKVQNQVFSSDQPSTILIATRQMNVDGQITFNGFLLLFYRMIHEKGENKMRGGGGWEGGCCDRLMS